MNISHSVCHVLINSAFSASVIAASSMELIISLFTSDKGQIPGKNGNSTPAAKQMKSQTS
jgi:hypothetical protein